MTWGAVAVTVGTALYSASEQRKASSQASDAQVAMSEAALAQQRSASSNAAQRLQPFTQRGYESMNAQADLLGLNGPQAQRLAMQSIEQSPMMASMLQQGENAMLQNASATGGLRGGNLQGALAQFRPNVLNSLIEQQYGRLGGLTQLGQASAAGQASIGMQGAGQVSGLLGNIGQAQAGRALGIGAANAGIANSFAQGAGMYYGMRNPSQGSGWSFSSARNNSASRPNYGNPVAAGTDISSTMA